MSLSLSNDNEIVFDVDSWNSKIKKAESLRMNHERSWYTNMAFYRGNQWVVWVKNGSTESGMSLTQPRSARKRLVYNKIKPAVRNEYTKLVKEEAEYYVASQTSDLGDMSASKTAEAVAEFILYNSKFDKYRRRATWWAVLCGTGYIKTIYDGQASIPGSNKVPSGFIGDEWEQPKGSVKYEAPSPFHIFVPYLDVEDIEEQPWVIHARTLDSADVEAFWGVRIEPDTDSAGLGFESRFLSSINVSKSNRFKQVYVKEVWVKPCRQYPDGLLCIYAGDKILHKGTWPYSHREYPFSVISSIPSGGFYAGSTVDDLISPQKEYNLTRSQLAEARDLTSFPAFTVTKGSVDINKIKARPGIVIEVQPGANKPERLINPDMPDYVIEELNRTNQDMDEISGQYEVTRGRTPPGVEAASAIAFLQEENDTRLYHTVASIAECVSKCGSQSLALVQQYWDATRIINTVSKTHVQGTLEFKGRDLKGNTDFRVVSGSMAPRSQTAKQAQIMEMIKMGIVPPELGLKYLQMSETNAMYDEMHVDVDQAKRENLRMSRGEEAEVHEWDNHQVHVHEHELYMKTQEFELLTPDVQQIYIEHRKQHQTVAVVESMQVDNGPETGESGGGDASGGTTGISEQPPVSTGASV